MRGYTIGVEEREKESDRILKEERDVRPVPIPRVNENKDIPVSKDNKNLG